LGSYLAEKLDLRSAFLKSCNKYSGKNFLGKHHTSKQSYVWLTYKEVKEYSFDLAKGIIERGFYVNHPFEISSQTSPHTLRLVGLCSKSCPEATLLDFAAIQAELTTVTIGSSDVSETNLKEVWERTGINTLFGFNDSLEIVSNLKLKKEIENLKYFINFDEVSEEDEKSAANLGLEVININTLINHGSELQIDIPKPNPESVFTLNFVSGAEKGVIITHKMVCEPIISLWYRGLILESSDTYFSYMPLAHIFERVMIMAITYAGGSIGYYRGDIDLISEDMKWWNPTILYAGCRLLTKFYKEINASIGRKNRLLAQSITWALSSKSDQLKKTGGVQSKMYDLTVLAPLKRKVVGSYAKNIIVGGDFVPWNILDFLRICWSVKIWEAYTNNSASGIISMAYCDDIEKHHVGGVMEHLELKLAEWDAEKYENADYGYTAEDIGRVLIRGPGVAENVFGQESSTESEGRWVDTGDIAYLAKTGAISLLGNINNQIVVGKRVVDPVRLEGIYGQIEFVKDILVWKDPNADSLMALVYLKPEIKVTEGKIFQWLSEKVEEEEEKHEEDKQEKDKHEEDVDQTTDLLHEETSPKQKIEYTNVEKSPSKGVEDILSAMKDLADANDLRPFEKIKKIQLISEPFRLQSSTLLPTLIPNRQKLVSTYVNMPTLC
jgi:long-chain acyl-CoA synthetase